jgi:triosephosphate isomerase
MPQLLQEPRVRLAQIVGEKVARALKLGLSVIACVGETLEERKSGRTMDVVISQLKPIASAC